MRSLSLRLASWTILVSFFLSVRPAQANTPLHAADLPQIIPMSEECVPLAGQLLFNLKSFHESARESRAELSPQDRMAQKHFQNISKILGNEAKRPCFRALATLYGAASLAAVEDEKLPTVWPLFLSLALNSHSQVEFLTPQIRKQQGCQWDRKGDKGQYLKWGGYSCQHRKIFVDPFLPPLNLAAHLTHELDHLLRDRLSLQKSLRDFEARAYLANDETLSHTLGAFLQLRMAYQDQFHGFQPGAGRAVDLPRTSSDEPPRYALSFDRDRFSKTGNMAQLFLHILKNSPKADEVSPTRPQLLSPFHFLVRGGFLHCSRYSGERELLNENQLLLSTVILQDVYRAYFNEQIPLNMADPNLPYGKNWELTQNCGRLAPLASFMSTPGSDRLYETLSFEKVTRNCEIVTSILNTRAAYSDYAGVCKNPSTGPIRPGNEGVRTELFGARLCLDQTQF